MSLLSVSTTHFAHEDVGTKFSLEISTINTVEGGEPERGQTETGTSITIGIGRSKFYNPVSSKSSRRNEHHLQGYDEMYQKGLVGTEVGVV